MFLTFGKARKLVAQYAGRGGLSSDSPEVHDFLIEVMQYILHQGQYGNVKKFCLYAVDGCFTVPYEIEVPLELKIDNDVGKVWNKWFEFNDANPLSDCVPADLAVYEDPNYYPTVHSLGKPSRVGVIGTCSEDNGKEVIVQGVAESGREIFTTHQGEQISGEVITIERGKIKHTTTVFEKITSITKPETVGYVQLIGIEDATNKRNFLSEYTPLETVPSYRRYRLTHPCSSPCKVTMLARIRVKDRYADNDRIFFDNILNLKTAAQVIYNMNNKNVDSAAAYDNALQTNVERENKFKKPHSNNPIRMNPITAGSSVKNIRRRRRFL